VGATGATLVDPLPHYQNRRKARGNSRSIQKNPLIKITGRRSPVFFLASTAISVAQECEPCRCGNPSSVPGKLKSKRRMDWIENDRGRIRKKVKNQPR
jgi:hypothetical protein